MGVILCGGMFIDRKAVLSFIPVLPPRHPIAGCKDEEGGDGEGGEVQSHVKRFQSKPQYRSNLQSRVSHLVAPTTAASAPPSLPWASDSSSPPALHIVPPPLLSIHWQHQRLFDGRA